MNKKGITLVTMVIYVALFFAFMTFASIMSSNMNFTALSNKGKIINEEEFQKLQYNIFNSAKNSTSIDKLYNDIVFSNNDEYLYDDEKKCILLNDIPLVSNVKSFDIVSIDKLKDVPETFLSIGNGEYTKLDMSKDYVCLNITFEKYGVETTNQIFVTSGDDI